MRVRRVEARWRIDFPSGSTWWCTTTPALLRVLWRHFKRRPPPDLGLSMLERSTYPDRER